MSEKERDSEIGNLVRNYQTQKQTLACLRSRADRYGRTLKAIGDELKDGELKLETQAAALPNCPSKEDIQRLLDELREARESLESTSRLLGEAGINLSPDR